MEESNLPL